MHCVLILLIRFDAKLSLIQAKCGAREPVPAQAENSAAACPAHPCPASSRDHAARSALIHWCGRCSNFSTCVYISDLLLQHFLLIPADRPASSCSDCSANCGDHRN